MKHQDVAVPNSGWFQLVNARVPNCMFSEELKNRFPVDGEGCCRVDLTIDDGKILQVLAPNSSSTSAQTIDLESRMVWPTLIDMHAHLDKGEVIPRVKADGTIPGAAKENMADRVNWTANDLTRRMSFGLRCAFVQGVSAIRTHLDYLPQPEVSWQIFASLREQWRGRVELQGSGLAALDLFASPLGNPFADMIASFGGILGGVTDGLGVRAGVDDSALEGLLDNFFEMAGRRGLDTDLHVDQGPEPFYLPKVAESVLRTGYKGRVVVDHCVNLALQTEEVVRHTLELCARAGIAFVTLPTPMMYLQDRAPGRTPRWRGVTLLHEIRAAGIPIALAGDNCRDYWFPYGDHDMVDIYRQGVRIFQLDHPLDQSPALVGPAPASIIGLPSLGSIQIGAAANLILFCARTLNEVLSRPQADRIVLNRGSRILDSLPDYTELD